MEADVGNPRGVVWRTHFVLVSWKVSVVVAVGAIPRIFASWLNSEMLARAGHDSPPPRYRPHHHGTFVVAAVSVVFVSLVWTFFQNKRID